MSRNDHSSEHISRWKPDREDLTKYIETILAPEISVEGGWTLFQYFEGSKLSIAGMPQKLEVTFSTGGCLADWELKRGGCFKKGVLQLDSPVAEYCSLVYDRLYVTRIRGFAFLVSQASLRRHLSNAYSDLHYCIYLYGYKRDESRKQIHDAWNQDTLYNAAHRYNTHDEVGVQFTSSALAYLEGIETDLARANVSIDDNWQWIETLVDRLVDHDRRRVMKEIEEADQKTKDSPENRTFNQRAQWTKERERLRQLIRSEAPFDVTLHHVRLAIESERNRSN